MAPVAPARPAFETQLAREFWDTLRFDAPPGPPPAPRAATATIFELFAGHAGLSAAAADLGCDVFPVDWAGNDHAPLVPAVPADLSTPEGQAAVAALMRATPPDFVWLAPPCGTFSRARDRPLPAAAIRAGARTPAPLRSDVHPLGLPSLSGDPFERVAKANALAAYAAACGEWCAERGVPFAIENPATSRLWLLPCFQRLRQNPGVFTVTFHHCRWGGKRPKHTMLVTSLPALRRLTAFCEGDHEHAPWAAFDAQGVWRFGTAEESEYPAELCRAIASLVVAAASGVDPTSAPPRRAVGEAPVGPWAPHPPPPR